MKNSKVKIEAGEAMLKIVLDIPCSKAKEISNKRRLKKGIEEKISKAIEDALNSSKSTVEFPNKEEHIFYSPY